MTTLPICAKLWSKLDSPVGGWPIAKPIAPAKGWPLREESANCPERFTCSLLRRGGVNHAGDF